MKGAGISGSSVHPSSLILHPFRRVASVSTVMALALLGDSLLYVVLPLHAAALGLSGWQVGVLLSANRWVRMLTNTVAARLMRRLLAGPLFTGATGLTVLVTALYTLTPAFAPFLLARFAWGFSFSTLRLGCFMTVLAAATDRSRGRLMGAYQSISRAGSFAATIAGGTLYDAFGYRTAVLAMAAGTALAVPLALRAGPAEGRGQRAEGRVEGSRGPGVDTGAASARGPRGWGALVRSARPRRSVTNGALEGGHLFPLPASLFPSPLLAVKWSAFAHAFVARGVVTATLSLFLLRSFGERFGPVGVATLAAWLLGVRWASEIGLAAPLGGLSDRGGRAPAAVGWLMVAVVAVLALALAPVVAVAIVAAGVLFVASSGLGATLDAAAGDLAPPHRRAEAMSSYADWADFGAALGLLLALSLADRAGLRPSYILGAVLLVLGAVGMALAFKGLSSAQPRSGGPER